MGRVARYKKIKSFDPFSKQNQHRGANLDYDTVGVWGLTGKDGRKVKKVSKTVQKLRARRGHKHQRTSPHVLDAAYEHGDDFDLNDMVGSLKKQVPLKLVDDDNKSSKPTPTSSSIKSSTSSTTALTSTPPTEEESCDADAIAPPASSSSTTDAGALGTTAESIVETTVKKANGNEYSNFADDQEEQKILRQLKLDAQTQQDNNSILNSIVKSPGRMPGESKKAYHRRVKAETRQIIQKTQQESHNPEKRLRKKEFLNQKKKRKSKKSSHNGLSSTAQQSRGADWDSDSDNEMQAATETRVVFGEQVEAPPVFRQRPRGATQPTAATTTPSRNNAKQHRKGQTMSYEQEAAEQQAMELMRRKVQAQYAHIKAQRKRGGEFHL